jgi:hypothetical protein
MYYYAVAKGVKIGIFNTWTECANDAKILEDAKKEFRQTEILKQ